MTEEATKSPSAVSRACAPFAARWDAEARRRARLRTPESLAVLRDAAKAVREARTALTKAEMRAAAANASAKSPTAPARRAARAEVREAKTGLRQAEAAYRTAKRGYPEHLIGRAIQFHTGHSILGTVASVAASTPWPVAVSAGLITLNAVPLSLGRRALAGAVDADDYSTEERQIMGRLAPEYWRAHAAERGLDGTLTTPPEMTPGGIRCEVRLDGRWTPRTFAERADSVRALLGARTVLRMRITAASRGDWAVVTVATRQATDGTSALWTPDRIPGNPLVMSLGLDVETGEEVLIPFDERLLLSGASGSGKSWTARPLLATAHMRGDLLFIDGKGEEANIWEGVCRTAVEPDEIADAIDEAHAEMGRRKRHMRKQGLSVWAGRQLTVFVDEGQAVLAGIKGARLQRLIELSSLGRSRGVVLWWATQYPITDGGAAGVHKLIAPNLLTRYSLRVATRTQSQVALDDCADYAPHQIPEGREWRGHGYLKGYGPRLIRAWTLDDDGVRGLPANHWHDTREEEPAAPVEPFAFPGTRPALRLVKGGAAEAEPAAEAPEEKTPAEIPAPPAAPPAGPPTNRDRVLDAIREGARTQADVRDRTGINKGTVSREVKGLIESGDVRKDESGMLIATGKEASA